MTPRRLLLLAALAAALPARAKESVCFGRPAAGRLEGGVALPAAGPNFSSYSRLASRLGRTHVHSRVARVVADSFTALQRQRPDTIYVIGESGWPRGGRFRPHRTHQNGLSVDFMVPVLDASGRSVPLPTSATKRFGYDLEFDARGRLGELQIDFAALAALLAALQRSARAQGVGIALVILESAFLPRLFATPEGAALRGLPFMKGKPWVRHDDHFHIDFDIPCKPL
jgi:penicillin-insensitive murein endopeptidase